MFAGAHTALVTPFTEEGTIDPDAFRAIIDRQVAAGMSGVVPVGTTGESSTLSTAEHHLVIELAVKQAAGRCLVIAGTGSNCTREAIELTQAAELSGADAALLVTPYYNKPSQEGLFQHYRAIAESTELPLMLYSIPGRCHVEIEVATMVRLVGECANIRAIKEAGGDVARVRALREALPEEIEILSGDDALTLDFIKAGACGVVSVAGNLVPETIAALVAAAREGRFADAEAIHAKSAPFFEALLKLDTNPVPIKAALALAGHCLPRLRLPMTPLPEEKMPELRAALAASGWKG